MADASSAGSNKLCLDGPAGKAEPKALRWAICHSPGRVIRKTRQLIVRVLNGWPTADILLDIYSRIDLIA